MAGTEWRSVVETLWTARRERPGYDPLQNQLTLEQSEKVLAACARRPLFSFVTTIRETPLADLLRSVHSVKRQHNPRWEMLLVDRGSQDRTLGEFLDGAPAADERVRVLRLGEDPGVAAAANAGLRPADGEFVALLDAGDELTPDALTWLAWTTNERPDALWFYSDEDFLGDDGAPHTPYFKPDFDPLLLLCANYTGRLGACAASVLAQVSGLRAAFDAAPDHDLALRLAEFVPRQNIVHIPRVLCHRGTASETAFSKPPSRPVAEDGLRAVAEALSRRGVQATASLHPHCPAVHQLHFEPARPAAVAVLVQTPAAAKDLELCLAALERNTSFKGYEVIVLERPTRDAAALGRAIEELTADFVVLLDGGVEIASPAWLEELVGVAQAYPEIAGVGAVLITPRERVAHAGIVLGLGDPFGSAHRGAPADSPRGFGHLQCLRETAAVSTAFALLSRAALLAAGGFEPGARPSLLNDVALCLKLGRAGFTLAVDSAVRGVVRGEALRALSPGADVSRARKQIEAWRAALGPDPHYNPNLLLHGPSHRPGRNFPPAGQLPALGARS